MNYVFYPIVHACIFGANLSPDMFIWFLNHHIMSPIICLLLLVEPNVKTKQDYDNSKTNIKFFFGSQSSIKDPVCETQHQFAEGILRHFIIQ